MKFAPDPRPTDSYFALSSGEAFVRGESTFGVICDRTFDVVCESVEASVAQVGMRIVHRYELHRLLHDAGESVPWQCTAFEVLEPGLAGRLIRLDASLSQVLPWRICVQAGPEMTTVTTAMPSIVISGLTHDPAVGRLARRFESALQIVLRSVASRVSGCD